MRRHKRIPLCAALLCLSATAATTPATAEPLTANRRYQGKVALEVPAFGLGFEVPAGFTGVLPAGATWFHIGRDNEEGRVFLYADRVSKAEMRVVMGQPFPVADLAVLTPTSAVIEENGALVGDYQVRGEAGYVGYAHVVTAPSGLSVALVAVAPSARIGAYKQLAKKIAGSLRFDVKPQQVAAGSVGNGAWAKALANKRVVRFHHGSGYSEKTQFLLCGDGRFLRSFGAQSLSINGSGVAQSKNAGHWSVQGDVLTLSYNGGEVVSVALEDRGGQLFVDGARWLREDAACP